MHNLLSRLEEHFPFVNRRAARESDFFWFCFKKGVEVVFSDSVSAGIYVLYNDEHFIFLNKTLGGLRLRYVMFHELGHYLFHSPSQSRFGAEFFDLHANRRNEDEAETVAALLLFPAGELNSLLQDPEIGDSVHLQQLAGHRIAILEKFRI